MIRIPTDRADWLQWAAETGNKLICAWKLRAYPKSFQPADNQTLTIIVTQYQQNFTTSQNTEKFYCKKLITNGILDGQGCAVACPLDQESEAKRTWFMDAQREDLSESWFDSNILPLVSYSCSRRSTSHAGSSRSLFSLWQSFSSIFFNHHLHTSLKDLSEGLGVSTVIVKGPQRPLAGA